MRTSHALTTSPPFGCKTCPVKYRESLRKSLPVYRPGRHDINPNASFSQGLASDRVNATIAPLVAE